IITFYHKFISYSYPELGLLSIWADTGICGFNGSSSKWWIFFFKYTNGYMNWWTDGDIPGFGRIVNGEMEVGGQELIGHRMKLGVSDYIGTAGNINDFFDSTGKGLENAGSARLGTNGRLYLPTASGRVFYGNQYVRTIALAKYGAKIGKVAGPVGNALSVVKVGIGVYEDGGTYGHHA
ncbi:hypothetical protein, partial [Chryseobacterium gossypii]|uniref:hypothetical protein n=1 Tax=Chryseobacterium gossypii TaxID=3231602 RepID=UPI003523D6D6